MYSICSVNSMSYLELLFLSKRYWGEALCQEREGVPRFLFYLAGHRPAHRVMSGCQHE